MTQLLPSAAGGSFLAPRPATSVCSPEDDVYKLECYAQTLRGLVSGSKPAAKPEPRQPQPKPREPPPKLAPRGGEDSYLGGMDLPSSESESDEERERYRPNYTPEDKATHLQTSVRS